MLIGILIGIDRHDSIRKSEFLTATLIHKYKEKESHLTLGLG